VREATVLLKVILEAHFSMQDGNDEYAVFVHSVYGAKKGDAPLLNRSGV